MTVPSALERKHGSKSILRKTEYNALVELAKANRVFASGVADEGSLGNYYYDGVAPKQVFPAFSSIEIPVYSVFCIKPEPTATYLKPLILEVEQANENNQQIYFTNSESGGFGDYSGSHFCCDAELISYHKIYILRQYTGGSAQIPRVGYPCGVKINTFEIDGSALGFNCIALDTPNKLVYATLGPLGQRWLVKPTVDITTNTGGNVNLWRGPRGSEVAVSPVMQFHAWNRTNATLKLNKFCEMLTIDGKIYAVPWEC